MKRVVRYWIDTSSTHKSALKVIATEEVYKMYLYNKSFPNGREVEGTNFYKISIGRNSAYDLVNENEFNKYIREM